MPDQEQTLNNQVPCRLCGLPVRKASNMDDGRYFCCNGCKMVHAMLMASDTCKGDTDFKNTQLFRQCVAAGIIPDPEEDSDTALQDRAPEDRQDPGAPGIQAGGNLLLLNFHVGNMWCPACAWVLENTLTRSAGIHEAACNFSSDRGSVLYDPVKTTPETIFKIIEKLGYQAASLEKTSLKNTRAFIRLAVTFFLTMNVMMLSWALYSGFFIELSTASVQMLAWPVLLMTSIVVFYGGYPIYMRALSGLKSGWPGMETLIAAGSFSTYFFSIYQLSRSSIHLYFDAASMLILLILTGKMIEQSAKNRITQSLAGFFSLVPKKVKMKTSHFPDGRYVSIEQLSRGDIFFCEQGEILAADGVVTQGNACIDESSITGEAKPVNAGPKDKVKSGSRVISGTIQVRALDVGESSILGRMLNIVENSLSGKTRRARGFETLLKFFVPGVMALSILTFIFWMTTGQPIDEAFNRGVSVLVISCPCALGIAIPLALTAGISAAGQKGILVRDFAAFERVARLDTIVFDKTGTLTTGKLEILGMDTAPEYRSDELWLIICAMEETSDHYIARTIRDYQAQQGIVPPAPETVCLHENGVSCRYQGKTWRLGSLDFAGTGSVRPGFLSSPGHGTQLISTVYLSVDQKIIAAIHLGDVMKKGMSSLVKSLENRGFETYLVSGDAKAPVLSAGTCVNIAPANIRSSLMPHEKADFINQLRQRGKTTAMVGDGINDAPAMARSDIAVAVHSGLHPARGVAAITLMQETPVQLLDFFHLATQVNRKVSQNLVFALVYNLVSIPVAAAGFLNPIIAACAMLLSSLSVTCNTWLLVRNRTKLGQTPLDTRQTAFHKGAHRS